MLNRPDLPTDGFSGVAVGFVATLLGLFLFPRLIGFVLRLFKGVILEAGMILLAGVLTEKAADRLGD